jgi:hypothetical protein
MWLWKRKQQKHKKNKKGPKNSYNMFWIVGKEHQGDLHRPWRIGRKI